MSDIEIKRRQPSQPTHDTSRSLRSPRVRRAVQAALAHWPSQTPPPQPAPAHTLLEEMIEYETPRPTAVGHASDVITPLPRRKPFAVNPVTIHALKTMRLARPFKISYFLAFRRLFVWLYGVCYFLGNIWWDKLKRQDTTERRAIRLRQTFSNIGGTFIKFGQQMAIRVDLLPYAYCQELGKLLDRVDPFPTEQAIEAIERTTGQPLAHTFQAFDPEPIGSASVACVYQAILHNGDKVAVKVRRPQIGELFEADFLVLGWLFKLVEFLTIVRPGFTENVLKETHDALLEELDFYKEARFQEIFRRRAHKAKRNFFSAPDLYPELCGEDVIVQEFVSGIWMSELLAAVETEDAIALDKIRRMNIDPKIVARRLLWVSHWGLWESTIFHADPHPANLIVQPDNRLVFIDFGAMGALTESRRVTMHQIFSLEKEEDLEGITRISLTLLEPLPPIDTEKVLKAIENVYWEGLIATRSKQSAWWERTSAQLWLGFFRVTSRFQIPMSFDTVRMIRATLLYDTLAARLDHDIDIGKQYRRFMKDAGDNAKGRVQKRVRQRLEKGLTEQDYVMIERVLKMSQQAIYQAHRLLNLDTYNFASLVGKFVSTLLMFLSLAFQILVATAVVSFLNLILQRLRGADAIGLQEALLAVISNPWYQAIVVILVLLGIRRSFFRLRDKEM